jgi:hypothetical protein
VVTSVAVGEVGPQVANDGKVLLTVLAGVGVIALLYYAQQQTGESRPIPEVQTEAQVMGLGVQAGMTVNAGTPLDTRHECHGWHPGFDPDPSAQPVVEPRVRYPAISGGNISTVMHNGWDRMAQSAPAGDDWRRIPPEAAVI